MLAGGVVFALASGPEGRLGQPAYALKQAFHPTHFFKCVGAAVVAWVVLSAWVHRPAALREGVSTASSQVGSVMARPVPKLGVYSVLLALAIILPPMMLSDYWQGVLVEQIGIYALLAIGLNVVVGFAGLLDLGYVAFYAIGAYTTAYFTGTLPVHPPFTLNPFFVIPLAVIAAMFAGLLLGAPTLRLRGDYLAIVTLGFGEIITIFAVNLDTITNGSRGAFGIPAFNIHLFGINYDFGLGSKPYYYLLLGFAVVILVAFSLLENSRVGRAWTAIREDEVAAQACGIPPVKYKLLAFTIGASTSGFAGALYASKIGYINPSSFTVSFSILVLVLVIFGGMGSLIGSVVGAAVLQTVFAYVRKNNTFDPLDIYIYVGALLILMMIFRPQGIVPSRRRAREIGLAEHGIGGADAMGAPIGSPTP
jgi:branched-chain amino acid transport system permease protein